MADTLKKLKKSLSLKLSFQAGTNCPRPSGSNCPRPSCSDRSHSSGSSSRGLSRSLSFQTSKSSKVRDLIFVFIITFFLGIFNILFVPAVVFT